MLFTIIKNKFIISIIDLIICPCTLISAIVMRFIRSCGIERMKISKKILYKIGVFPIRDHYYEPLFNMNYLKKDLRMDRMLPAIDLNVKEQLEILNKFNFNSELIKFPINKTKGLEYYYNNSSFASGDSEYLYNIIRLYKPKRIVEIGSGNSTLMAINAIKENKIEDNNYNCEHICIEPYEMKWLESVGVKVMRNKVEDVEKEIFLKLDENDILFIDSSHIIRPQGDVLLEYLEILPILKSGVLIHVHDIFIPRDYLNQWVIDENKFWNEQYLLEAFLSFNKEFQVIGSVNYLKHNYYEELSSKCPILARDQEREPGSFWMKKL